MQLLPAEPVRQTTHWHGRSRLSDRIERENQTHLKARGMEIDREDYRDASKPDTCQENREVKIENRSNTGFSCHGRKSSLQIGSDCETVEIL
jgi:hypothetical protein